jgi:predicted HAD superfamily Cof-like phosphohydrolase
MTNAKVAGEMLDHLKPENNHSRSEVENTHKWFVASGQMPEQPEPNVRAAALYMGLQLEEMAEKLGVIGMERLSKALHSHADLFKSGANDDAVRGALTFGKAKELLDSDMDLLWVTMGAAYAQGADVAGAYGAVGDANWAKFPNGVVTLDGVTGKVVKPEGWTPPDLTPFVHPSFVADEKVGVNEQA